MRRKLLWISCPIIAAMAYMVQAAPRPGACAEITAACTRAGFVEGGARAGNGLLADCIVPIMRGTFQRPKSSRPLPPIDARVVAACKAENPRFGEPSQQRI